MQIEKTNNEYGSFDVELINGDRKLAILRRGGDILFSPKYLDYRKIDQIDFLIPTDDNLYPLFDKLYLSIINGDVLGEDKSDEESLRKYESVKSYSTYKNLVTDGVISFLSDATPLKAPNELKIVKTSDGVLLVFTKVTNKEVPCFKPPFSIDVEVRQSGSRYEPFHIPFNHLYRSLQDFETVKKEEKELVKK